MWSNIILMGMKVKIEKSDEHILFDDEVSSNRINLNDLLKRAKAQEKHDKKINFLVFSGVAGVALVTVLLLSL
tara:strand:+ start:337 stop:555 length:219 start_codon:yes stop_codon:yes gene_type:complete